MADPSPTPLPIIPPPLVLAVTALQAAEEFVQTDEPTELALLAISRPWTVTYVDDDRTSIITLPDQQVTETDLPMLTALFEELVESDPVPPYDLKALVAGAVRRLTSVNAGDVGEDQGTS